MKHTLLVLTTCVLLASGAHAQTRSFPWLDEADTIGRTVIGDTPVPSGYERVETERDSFGDWLRSIPLKPEGSAVHLYDGRLKSNQGAHYRVLDIDVGSRNLQQCADAVIRLRAEYLYSQNRYDDIHFNFTSGDTATFRSWIDGYRPAVQGNDVSWHRTADPDSSYDCFRKYLDVIFTYCGSYSLNRELKDVGIPEHIQVGDIFIQGGFPGHAVIVVDAAIESANGRRVVLLAQSYMPAQEIHILKNLRNPDLSPWFEINGADKLYTPEWTFNWDDLRCF
jgi:hypothetical protein